MIRFLQPEWLWLLTVLPVVMLFRGRRGPVAAVEFSDVGLAREVARSSRARIGHFLWLLPLLAAALMIIGLARPQRAHSSTEVTANGIDIVLALDVSGSMQALDFLVDNRRVNRIQVVKSVVSRFIEERPNARIGLIAFAAAPYLVSPLTLDHDWLQQNLERVSTALAGEDGTAIGDGLGVALTTPGPGAANAIAAFGEAAASGSPVLLIASEVSTALRRPGVVRGILHESRDQAALFAPLAKAVYRPESGLAAIEAQIERFAPGFRDRVIARHTMGPAAME